MLLGVCVLLASLPAWLGAADFDHHFSYNHRIQDPTFEQERETTPYDQLSTEEKQYVDAAIDGRSFDFEDDSREMPSVVERGGTDYALDSARSVDWLNPGSFGPVLGGIAGFWLVFEAVQHERAHLGPHGV
ncbi:hypothetical protein [Halococcus hamelinensis]|uniref:DUF7979 domain-containing protein n=1 Tax=Halococcus hamelinensis 100A6 TaxID=1132509 RepID=M0M3F5_9EURY|nr:hypothetical protein [Halococcus hamelinensis]EMA39134.1 hypothetical protein C447_07398 [Halococcus hamelinensis 100A6]